MMNPTYYKLACGRAHFTSYFISYSLRNWSILATKIVANGGQIYTGHCDCGVYNIGLSVDPLWSGRNSRNYLRFPSRCKLLWYHRDGSMRIRPTIICNLCLTQTHYTALYNTLSPRKNEHYFADITLRCILLDGNCCILLSILLNFAPGSPIDSKSALDQIITWHRTDYKALFKPNTGLIHLSIIGLGEVITPKLLKKKLWHNALHHNICDVRDIGITKTQIADESRCRWMCLIMIH